MAKRPQKRHVLLGMAAISPVLSGVAAESAAAHPGAGDHDYCGRVVQPAERCPIDIGSTDAFVAGPYLGINWFNYPGQSAIPVCGILDEYYSSTVIDTFKACAWVSGNNFANVTNGPPDYCFHNGTQCAPPPQYKTVATVYNASNNPHTLRGTATGYSF